MDVFSADKRSAVMSRIGSKDTKPEKIVRRILHSNGYRFRLHESDLPGRPDIVLPGNRAVVFVHGCFWHGHEYCSKGTRRPKTHPKFWREKILGNAARDRSVARKLRRLGWRVLTVWECETKNAKKIERRLCRLLENGR